MTSLVSSSEPRQTPSTDLSMIKAVPPFNEVDTRAIIRQVEFYFSDQNLPHDRHLLGRTGGDGNGATSLNEICSFKKMRPFKPRSAIKEVLKRSAVIDLVNNGKMVKRRFPLTVKLLVQPKVDLQREHIEKTLASNPHLTKNLIKPTGFEANYVDFPISPQEHEKNMKLYDPEFSFWLRIESAISQYCSKRKMHQSTKRVFDLWMEYGGIANSSPQFAAGQLDFDTEHLDKEEVAMMKHQYNVSDLVLHNEEKWSVDFEHTAIGFLSTEFLSWFEWDRPDQVRNVCNVMTNFFNFLLHYNVCPEYTKQLHLAKHAVDEAETELYMLPKVDKEINHPHSFNAACAIAFSPVPERNGAIDRSWDDTPRNEEKITLSKEDARKVFAAGIAAFGKDGEHEQKMKAFEEPLSSAGKADTNIITEIIGLEITAIELAENGRAQLFTSLKGTIVPKMGLMHCKRWRSPCAPVYDAPPACSRLPATFGFILNESALMLCSVGMKLEAEVKMVENAGLCWIDEICTINPSFYLWLPNTRMKQTKQRQKDHDAFQAFLRNNPQWIKDENGRYVCSELAVETTA